MVYLPEELITDILLRLPVICLLRCLCVCKDWHRFIKSPRFVNLHLNHPSRSYFLIFSRTSNRRMIMPELLYYCLNNGSLLNTPLRPPSVPEFSSFFQQLYISKPCNGLFCVVEKGFTARGDSVFVCNPATRRSRRLPSQSHVQTCNGISACGLGIDPRTNEFKVVTVLNYDLKDYGDEDYDGSVSYRLGIYNLSSNSWREVETVLPDAMKKGGEYNGYMYVPPWIGGGLFFKGCLHWSVEGLDILLCVDLTTEVVTDVPLPLNVVPEHMNKKKYIPTAVMVLEDCLAWAAVAAPSDRDQTRAIFVWKMMDYGAGDSWMMRFSISVPFLGDFLHPISLCKEDTMILLDRKNSEVFFVNLKEDGCLKTQRVEHCDANAVILLKESLVPL